jgi:outer membrane protein assembly factor BamB/predicted Ser/Thr protein kinase
MRPLGDTDPLAIANYRLLGVLGSGGMGKVYLGESRSGRRVAIKVVRSELANDAGWRRRFTREVAAVRSVSPLFTAAVVDADTDAAEPWLATTFIDGPSLASWVNQAGPLAPGAVLVLAAGLAEALASIHKAGLVHRDLKPSNVIINDDGPQIIDFGIALTADTPATTSMLLGTPSYIAPERIHGSEADPASDIFSLGATLVFAATGRPLVTEGPVYAQLMQITTGRFDLSPVPGDLRPLIVRCVSHQPRDRPTAEELSRILLAARVPRPAPGWYARSGPITSVPVVPGPPLLTRRRVLTAAGLLGAAAATTGVVVLLPPERVTPRAYGLPAAPSPSGPTPPVPPPQPGEVVWQLASGTDPVAPSPGNPSAGLHIIADGQRVITTQGSNLYMVRPSGKEMWRTSLPSSLLTLRPWGSAVLVNDTRRVWSFDRESGEQIFFADLVAPEEAIVASSNPDNVAVQIADVAIAGDRAFVSLATACVALAPNGEVKWRKARLSGQGADARPTAGGPVAATDQWVLVQHVLKDPLTVRVSLRRADTGEEVWNESYPAGQINDTQAQNPPPQGGQGPPPAGEGRDGNPPPDEDWSRWEGRLAGPYAVLREGRELHVFGAQNGGIKWIAHSETPLATLEVVGDLVLLGADRLTARNIASGSVRWQVDLRGARVGGTADGRLVIAASGTAGVVVAYDRDGTQQWRTPIPTEFTGATPEHIITDDHTAYITFRVRGEQAASRIADVLAIALDASAKRLQ